MKKKSKMLNELINKKLEEIYQKLENLKIRFKEASNDVKILQFDIPRALREQANICRIQGKYSDAKELLIKVLSEQKPIYDAMKPGTSFKRSPTVAATYKALIAVCEDEGGTSSEEINSYIEEMNKINAKINRSN